MQSFRGTGNFTGEQPSGKPDVYALGVVLVEIVTGETRIINAQRLPMKRPGSENGLLSTAEKIGVFTSMLQGNAESSLLLP
ncbi:uncharacterized protein CCR75_006410 [Bremia lactucae]|uniref:Protein kinase domain-containing protein n=1 Tax=Bremia lactucae TaxID=4779 RepID=A0A976FPJ8_BRELC|nr:hypothetical protein CCR75_006410 [Bremia lactucae]